MSNQFSIRSMVVCVIAIAAAWILTEVVWGMTGGVVGGLSIKTNPEYQQKVTAFLQSRGIDTHADMPVLRASYSKLAAEDRKELYRMSRDLMRDINWFAVTSFVSVIVFGLVGLLSGIITKAWLLSPLIPAASFLLNNPIIRFAMARELPAGQKTLVVILQFLACCFLAWLGASVATKAKRNGNSPSTD